jgi:hypothetical protein
VDALAQGRSLEEAEDEYASAYTNEPADCQPIVKPTSSQINSDIHTAEWLQKVKPCGWFRQNCPSLISLEVIEANTHNAPGNDEGTSGTDLQTTEYYITQFDVGITAEMVAYDQDSNYSQAFGGTNGYPGLIRLTGGISASDPTNLSTVATYVEGETCLEVHAKAADDWEDIHGNSYNCMGLCGSGCDIRSGGYSRNCMKHDVCSAVKSMVQGFAADGNCHDVDCGDEQMQTTSHVSTHEVSLRDEVLPGIDFLCSV